MTISFTVPGVPVPQSRPRFTRQGRAYDTAACKAYKREVAKAAKVAMSGREPLRGAIACYMIFYMPIPKSLSRKKRQELTGDFMIKKPDTDNLAKAVLDGCCGIVYADDAQVATLYAKKVYGEEPWVEVEFEGEE